MTVRQPVQNITGRIAAKRELLAAAWADYKAGTGDCASVVYAEVALAAAEQERVTAKARREGR